MPGRARCWSKPVRSVFGDGAVLHVVDGRLVSNVTVGKVRRWLAAGVVVEQYRVDGTGPQAVHAARTLIEARLAGDRSGDSVLDVVRLDRRLVDGLTPARVARWRADRRVFPDGCDGWDDVRAYQWMRASRHSPGVFSTAWAAVGGSTAVAALHDSDPRVWTGRVLLAANGWTGRIADPQLATGMSWDEVERTPLLAACRARLVDDGTWAGSAFESLSPVAQVSAALAGIPAGGIEQWSTWSDREWLWHAVGYDPNGSVRWNDWWPQVSSTGVGVAHDRLGAGVAVLLRGKVPLDIAGQIVDERLAGEVRGLAVDAFSSTVAMLSADGSVERSDIARFATGIVATFGKASDQILTLASRKGWTGHDVANVFAAAGTNDKGLADWVLRNSSNFHAGREGVNDLRLVASAWNEIGASVNTLTPRAAARFVTAAGKLSPEWMSTVFASAVSQVPVSKSVAKQGALLWLASQRTTSIFPADMSFQSNGYAGRFEPRSSGLAPFIGELTDCCQHVGGAGEACAIDSQMNPTSGLFVVRDRDGRIVAQSWVWFDSGRDGVCFDNIEWAHGALTNDAKEARGKTIQEVYKNAANHLAETWGVDVTVGVGYTDRTVIDGLEPAREMLEPDGYHDSYSDASGGQRQLAVLPDEFSGGTWRPAGSHTWFRWHGVGLRATTAVSSENGRFVIQLAGLADTTEAAIDEHSVEYDTALSDLADVLAAANPSMDVHVGRHTRSATIDVYAGARPDDLVATALGYDTTSVTAEDLYNLSQQPRLFTQIGGYINANISSVADMQRLHDAGISGRGAEEYKRAGITNIDDMTRANEAGIHGHAVEAYTHAGITKLDDMIRAREAGVIGGGAEAYKRAGITKLDDMIRAREAGINVVGAASYARAGITNIDDMIRAREAGIYDVGAAVYVDAGITNLDDMILAHKARVHSEDAEAYARAGITKLDDMIRAREARVNSENAEAYERAGITKLDDMIRANEAGIYGNAEAYARAGITKLDDMIRARRAVLHGNDAEAYARAGITKLDDMLLFRRSDTSWNDLEKYANVGITNLDDMIRALQAGVSWKDAERYANVGITNLDDMIQASKAGVSRFEADTYANVGITNLDDMIRVRKAGIDGNEAAFYRRANITSLDDMILAHKAGFNGLEDGISGYDADRYARAGITNLDDMILAHKARVHSEDAEAYARAGITNLDDMIRLHRAGISGRDAETYASEGVTTVDGMILRHRNK
jgi:hypothetical protein